MNSLNKPIVWMVWDGAAGWATRRMLEEGKLPNLCKIMKNGSMADAIPPSPNCQTPPSLATLFTGTWPRNHGIHGFSIPNSGVKTSVLESTSGFDIKNLKAEPIWSYIGEKNYKSVLVHIPWAMPLNANKVSKGVMFAVEGYSKRVTRGGVLEVFRSDFEVEKSYQVGPYEISVYVDVEGVAKINSNQTGHQIILKPDEERIYNEHCLNLNDNNKLMIQTHLRKDDGALLVMYSGVWEVRTSNSKEQDSYEDQTGPFIGEGLGNAYRRGVFGPRLIDGGDGQAEKVLVSTIKWAAQYFRRSSAAALRKFPNADLYMIYQPCIDDIEHEMIGWCDPQSKCYCPEIAEKAWLAICEVYQMADDHLNDILTYFDENCTIVISSDHGMAGMTHTVHINEALQKNGLLKFNDKNEIDLSTTSLFYHPANNGSIWVNPDIKDKAKRKDILLKTVEILRSLLHSNGNVPVLKAIYPMDSGDKQDGYISAMGDLFLEVSDGFELSDKRSSSREIIVPTLKSASHATNSKRSSLHGIFYAKGEGISENMDLGKVDNRSLVPLICSQLGILPPPNIEGIIPSKIKNSYQHK